MYINRLSFIFYTFYRNGTLYGRVNSARWSSFTYDYIRNEHLIHVPPYVYHWLCTHIYMFSWMYRTTERVYMCKLSTYRSDMCVYVLIVLIVCEACQYINTEIGYFIRRSTHVYASHMWTHICKRHRKRIFKRGN